MALTERQPWSRRPGARIRTWDTATEVRITTTLTMAKNGVVGSGSLVAE
jgi:hypothetical protein